MPEHQAREREVGGRDDGTALAASDMGQTGGCGGGRLRRGGPGRNARAQIVRPDGSPIPRLYSAGELGSIYSYLYQGTGNIGECLAFGRIAGRNAVSVQPWH